MTEENNKARALILSALMVISVFAGTLALSGAAVGATQSLSAASVPDAPGNTDGVTHTVTFDVTIDGNSQDQLTINYSDINGVAVQSVSASSSSAADVEITNTQPNNGDAQVAILDSTADGTHTVTITVDTVVDVSADPVITGLTLGVTSSNTNAETTDTFNVVTGPGAYDETLTEGDRFWSGQTLYNDSFDSNDQGVELQRDTSNGWQFVTEVNVNDAGEVLLDTSDRQTDTYRLIDTNNESGATASQVITFDLSAQEYSSSADPTTVTNAGEGTSTDITVESNRNSYTHLISSPSLSPSDINASIGGIGTLVDADGDGDNEFVSVPGTTSDTLTADFAGVGTGNYTLNFQVADTGVTTSETIEVDEGATGNVEFNQSVYNEEQGDVASIVIDMENGAETTTVTIGSDDVNYVVNATVTDEDEDGQVTLLWNTSETDPAQYVYAGDGTTLDSSNVNDGVSQRLGATEYELSAEFAGEESSVAVISVTDPNNVERNARTWTASGGIALEDLEIPGDVSQDSEIATGDYVVLQFETAGIYGNVSDSSDLNAPYGTDNVSVLVRETSDSAGVNADRDVELAGNFTLIADEANNQFFLVAKQSELSNVNQDETFTATLTIGEDNPYVSDTQTVSTTFSIAEQSATLDDGATQVESSENATVSGTSSLSAGSEITVRLRNSGGENPFLKQTTVDVGENGDWSAQFDLSDVPAGTNFTINVLSGGNTLLDDGAVDAQTVEAASANLQLASLDAPETAEPGETITVTATVENTGGAEGTQNVSFVFEGETVSTQEVTVSAGSTQQVTFEATAPEETGDYTHGVQVGDNEVVEATLTVESGGETTTTSTTTTDETTTTSDDGGDTTTTSDEDDDTETTSTGQPGFGVAVALVALVAAALLAVRRNN